MASGDEYQQAQFWKPTNTICLEQGVKGECLMSAQFVILDLSKSDEDTKIEMLNAYYKSMRNYYPSKKKIIL